MTVKELIEALKHFPEDKEVWIHAQKGFISYDAADYISGPMDVNCIEEADVLNKKYNKQIKLSHVDDDEVEHIFRERGYSKIYYDEHPQFERKKDGIIYIKTHSGKGNYKEFENKIV